MPAVQHHLRRPVSVTFVRQIVYLRPSQFVAYDRTGICNASLDQYLAFHFPSNPVEVPAAPGVHRYDVNPGQFAGSMTTILPANAATVTTDRVSTDPQTWNKLWRTEIRPTDAAAAARRWLTVFDLAGTSAQVARPGDHPAGRPSGLCSNAGYAATVFGTAPLSTSIAGAFLRRACSNSPRSRILLLWPIYISVGVSSPTTS